MSQCIEHSNIRSFADDTRIQKSIKTIDDVRKLQIDMDNVAKWSIANNMQLHQNKTEFLQHCFSANARLLRELPFVMYDQIYKTTERELIYPNEVVKDLGITVCTDLSWTSHINIISERARKASSWVLSVFKTRDHYTMLTLYKSLIRSHLEYCCLLWHPHNNIKDTQTLEGVQRTFTRKILGYEDMSYWTRLKSLQLMSLQRRRERYIILYMWKILHNLAPNDISITWNYNDRFGIQAHVPPIPKNKKAHNLYEHSLAVLGPKLWNLLPSPLTTLPTLDSFKASLSSFITKIPDRPPTQGYPSSHNNSLLDWCKQSGWTAMARWP